MPTAVDQLWRPLEASHRARAALLARLPAGAADKADALKGLQDGSIIFVAKVATIHAVFASSLASGGVVAVSESAPLSDGAVGQVEQVSVADACSVAHASMVAVTAVADVAVTAEALSRTVCDQLQQLAKLALPPYALAALQACFLSCPPAASSSAPLDAKDPPVPRTPLAKCWEVSHTIGLRSRRLQAAAAALVRLEMQLELKLQQLRRAAWLYGDEFPPSEAGACVEREHTLSSLKKALARAAAIQQAVEAAGGKYAEVSDALMGAMVVPISQGWRGAVDTNGVQSAVVLKELSREVHSMRANTNARVQAGTSLLRQQATLAETLLRLERTRARGCVHESAALHERYTPLLQVAIDYTPSNASRTKSSHQPSHSIHTPSSPRHHPIPTACYFYPGFIPPVSIPSPLHAHPVPIPSPLCPHPIPTFSPPVRHLSPHTSSLPHSPVAAAARCR